MWGSSECQDLGPTAMVVDACLLNMAWRLVKHEVSRQRMCNAYVGGCGRISLSCIMNHCYYILLATSQSDIL